MLKARIESAASAFTAERPLVRNLPAPDRKALSIAREQEARFWELRAAVSLARHHLDQGLHAEARDLVAPVYGWFTEGFDTPDLKDAKQLLNQSA